MEYFLNFPMEKKNCNFYYHIKSAAFGIKNVHCSCNKTNERYLNLCSPVVFQWHICWKIWQFRQKVGEDTKVQKIFPLFRNILWGWDLQSSPIMISVHPLWSLEWNASIEWLLPRGLKSCSSKSTFTFTIILQKIGNQAKTNVRKFFRDDGQLFKRSKYKKNNSGFARRKHVSMLIEQNILYATITLVLLLFCTGEFYQE